MIITKSLGSRRAHLFGCGADSVADNMVSMQHQGIGQPPCWCILSVIMCSLTQWRQVMHTCASKLGHYWFTHKLVACSAPSHYLCYWWRIVIGPPWEMWIKIQHFSLKKMNLKRSPQNCGHFVRTCFAYDSHWSDIWHWGEIHCIYIILAGVPS